MPHPATTPFGRGTASNDGIKPFPLMFGLDLFNHRSLTGLSRSPLEDLASFVTGGIADVDVVPEPVESTLRVLNSGSVVVINPTTAPRFLDYAYAPNAETFIDYLPGEDGCMEIQLVKDNMDKVWSTAGNIRYKLEDESWVPEYVDAQGKVKEAPKDLKPLLKSIPAADVLVIPNGRGVLYWAQDIYWRLEEIAATERRIMTGSNLLPIISGNIGGSSEVQTAFMTAKNAIILPGVISIDRVVSNAVMQMLMDWFNDRRTDWYAAMNVVEQDTPNRPVASDRQLRMLAMHLYTKRTRRVLEKLYTGLGVNIQLAPVSMLTIEERLKMLELLNQLLAGGTIDQVYFDQAAKMLTTD